MTTHEEKQARTLATIADSIKSGFTLTETVRMLLDVSLAEFARRYGFRQEEVSMCLLGYSGRRLPKVRKRLAKVLGLKIEQIDSLIDVHREHAGADGK
jgi:predicted transcriptional regulator